MTSSTSDFTFCQSTAEEAREGAAPVPPTTTAPANDSPPTSSSRLDRAKGADTRVEALARTERRPPRDAGAAREPETCQLRRPARNRRHRTLHSRLHVALTTRRSKRRTPRSNACGRARARAPARRRSVARRVAALAASNAVFQSWTGLTSMAATLSTLPTAAAALRSSRPAEPAAAACARPRRALRRTALHATSAEQQTQPLRVAVVGGGLAGLALGVALQRRGLEATVFERERNDTAQQALTGIQLWPWGVEALSRIGSEGMREAVLASGDVVRAHTPLQRTLSAGQPALHRRPAACNGGGLEAATRGCLPLGTVPVPSADSARCRLTRSCCASPTGRRCSHTPWRSTTAAPASPTTRCSPSWPPSCPAPRCATTTTW